MLTLKNVSSEPVANVQLNAVIRRVGETEEWGGAFQKVDRQRRHSAGRQHQTYRAAVEPRIHWHRTARADAEEQPVRRRPRPGVRQARRQSVDEAGRVANRARDAHSVALRAFARHTPLSKGGSVRSTRAAIIVANVIGGGILFTPPQVAAMVPHPVLVSLDVGRRRRARVLRRDGVRRAGGAAAARGRRIRLSARGVRTARRLHDRVDVVRRRVRRRDGRERDLSRCSCSIVSFPASANSTPFFVDPASVRAADVLASHAAGDRARSGCSRSCTFAASARAAS